MHGGDQILCGYKPSIIVSGLRSKNCHCRLTPLLAALDSTPTSIWETTGNLNMNTGNYGKLRETTVNYWKLQ